MRNTIGGMHTYVLPVTPGTLDAAGLRQEQAKGFYVSPFLDMDLHYRFRMLPPGDIVRIRILECDRQGPVLAATFHGERRAVTSANLLRACLAFPFLTIKIFAAILWQALKLWLKGAQYRPAPPASTEAHAPGREQIGVTR